MPSFSNTRNTLAHTLGILLCLLPGLRAGAQQEEILEELSLPAEVLATIDRPANVKRNKETIICFYVLPNGNSTAQTRGKRMEEGDDWHYDIQHIAAQTRFIRRQIPKKNFIVIYLENEWKSWPLWKQRHPDYPTRIPQMIDSLAALAPGRKITIHLNGHSGGGSLVFGYLAGVERIPEKVKRISFIDSNYGYDTLYYDKLKEWLLRSGDNALNVFAYNDSLIIYNGKPLVSPTGGTWYRSRLMLRHFEKDFRFRTLRDDSLVIYHSRGNGRLRFYLHRNPHEKILHTVQVERNGFIHSELCGTRSESRNYTYYGERAYSALVK